MGRSKKTTTTTRRDIPQYVERGSQEAVALGRQIAARPYVEYGGERIAGPDPAEEEAYRRAMAGDPQAMADLERSRQYAETAATPWTEQDVEAYMSPYIKGALDPAAREIREEMLREQQRIGGKAGMVSAFGGSRQALLEAEAARGGKEAISDLYGRGYAQAFESARDQINKDRAAARAASEQFKSISAEGKQQFNQDMQNLLTTGGLKRSLRQAGLDFDYQQFVEARDWDITNLQPLLAALSAVPYSETQTATTKQKKSALQTVVGLGVAAFSAYTGNVKGVAGGLGMAGGGDGAPAPGGKTIGKTGSPYPMPQQYGVGPYTDPQTGATFPGLSWGAGGPTATPTPWTYAEGGVY